MQPNLEQAKALVLKGTSYAEAARLTGFQASIKLYTLLDNDPDIVAARANGTLKTRESGNRSKGPDYYAAKAHVRAVIDEGLTHTEAAIKFGVSQPLVSRHVRLAGAAARRGRPPEVPPAPPAPDADVSLILQMAQALATSHNTTARALLERTLQSLPT